ncbi:MAG: SUMF1/EgtB/PvdO family nonheme iron enzyme [Candidatus Delongbacteria bacterium]|nr:SUMF1/EgtB/PvdO family nonheme iron enzyme [Candidatus Delongbacteria bacterium]
MRVLLLLLGLVVVSLSVHAQNVIAQQDDKEKSGDSAGQKSEYKIQIVPVEINSDPEGAVVYIADQEIGPTPISFSYPTGKHKIKIIREYFEVIEETITIKSPKTKKTYTLTDMRATLIISTFKKAKVFINDKPEKNDKEIKLLPQEVNIRVEMTGANTLRKQVILGGKEIKTINMYPEFPTGTIQVEVIPDDAGMYLWETGEEKYIGLGNKIFPNLPAGNYKLKVSRKGYKSQTEEIILADKAIERKSFILKKGADVGGEYILVKGGKFGMGSNVNFDEKPIHGVTVSDYYIGKYEVTQAEWDLVLKNNPSNFRGDSLPVESVSWYDAVEFCNKLSAFEGLQKCYSISGKNIKCDFGAKGYRLPTEAEWEYAARSGNNVKIYNYCGSDSIPEVAEYEGNNNESTKPVGGKKACDLGIFDMTGNVEEWCWDWYDPYPNNQQNNPTGPDKGFVRIVRGGSWYTNEIFCRVRFRNLYNPDESYFYLGFRVVRSK